MDDIGTYQERKFPAFRNPTIDVLEHGRKKHHIPLLLEIDVTEARTYLRQIKAESGQSLSFTAWVMACVGRAVSEHKNVHALRKGRRRLILFDDVDISVLVERALEQRAVSGDGRDGDGRAQTLPMPTIIRKTNEKSVQVIHNEIRAAQEAPLAKDEVQIGGERRAWATRLFAVLPAFLRHLIVWRRLARDPFLAKKMMGTVVVTSAGSVGTGSVGKENGSAWGIPLGIHPLIVAVGSIARKPGVVGEAIEIREVLSLTVLFDHDVTDGAPVARFVQTLKELLATGYALDEISSGAFK
ncbi:MAG TPA: 2-oxo acid dehydrogenase subunit E2 [Chloroflexota bacterium]|nr:2-oxo acid dehydrogenase subunit E2 [Chloroflexota bacterium]